MFLQEVHCKSDDTVNWAKYWSSDVFLSGNSSNSAGIAIILSGNYTVVEYEEILTGRLQTLTIKKQR